jgi:alpha-amylase/alpha-mannosidase (GH57 family)
MSKNIICKKQPQKSKGGYTKIKQNRWTVLKANSVYLEVTTIMNKYISNSPEYLRKTDRIEKKHRQFKNYFRQYSTFNNGHNNSSDN